MTGSHDGLLLTLVLVTVLAATLALLLWQHTQQVRRLEANRLLLEQHLQQNGQQLGTLTQELALARAEARQEAEHQRAASQETYAAHLGALQSRMHEVIRITQNSVDNSRQATDARLQHLTGSLTDQLGSNNKMMMAVQEQLGALGQAAHGMHALGKDIASLQDILRAPKLRGNLGELFLAEILRQVLPPDSFTLQHRFAAEGEGVQTIVDAVIHLGDRLVPIDSKFPLESFRRILAEQDNPDGDNRRRHRKQFLEVVRAHIDVVAAKYIRPDANTYDFAMVYLPAENVYYEAVVRQVPDDGTDSIVTYAAQKRVIPVSPSTLYAYLLTVAYGLKGMHIERQAENIRGQLAAFNKKFVAFYKDLEKTGRHLDLAHRNHEEVMRRGIKLNDQVGKITGAALHIGDDEADEAAALPQKPASIGLAKA